MPFVAFDRPSDFTRNVRIGVDARQPPINWLTATKAAYYVGVSLAALRKRWRTHNLSYFDRSFLDYVRVVDLRDWISERSGGRYVPHRARRTAGRRTKA